MITVFILSLFCSLAIAQDDKATGYKVICEVIATKDKNDSVSTRLARFLDSKVDSLLEEFTMDMLTEEEDFRAGLIEKAIVADVIESFKNVVNTIKDKNYPPEAISKIFNSIFKGVRDVLPLKTTTTTTTTASPTTQDPNVANGFVDGLSTFADWPHICHLLWYPYHQEKCGESRCLACAPAMMASAQVRELLNF